MLAKINSKKTNIYYYDIALCQLEIDRENEIHNTFKFILSNIKKKHTPKKKTDSIQDINMISKITKKLIELNQHEAALKAINHNKTIFPNNRNLRKINSALLLEYFIIYSKKKYCDIEKLYQMLLNFRLEYSESSKYKAVVKKIEKIHWQIKMINIVNKQRAKGYNDGTTIISPSPPLIWKNNLAKAAELHAKDMNHNDFCRHHGSGGSTLSKRIKSTGYKWFGIAENLAKGDNSVEEAIKKWMENKQFRKNLMHRRFRDFGAGKEGVSWVQNFGYGY